MTWQDPCQSSFPLVSDCSFTLWKSNNPAADTSETEVIILFYVNHVQPEFVYCRNMPPLYSIQQGKAVVYLAFHVVTYSLCFFEILLTSATLPIVTHIPIFYTLYISHVSITLRGLRTWSKLLSKSLNLD